MRLIDADAYRDEFMNGVYDELADDSDNYRANRIIDLFDNAPTIDAVPVVHARWYRYSYDEAICTHCGYDRGTEFECTKEAVEKWGELPKYCEACGAKMDE